MSAAVKVFLPKQQKKDHGPQHEFYVFKFWTESVFKHLYLSIRLLSQFLEVEARINHQDVYLGIF